MPGRTPGDLPPPTPTQAADQVERPSAPVEPRAGERPASRPSGGGRTAHGRTPWSPWRDHQPTARPRDPGQGRGLGRLLGGVRNFQQVTAPLVQEELARLAKDGQRPSQLFLTCADSRLVTSMITSSGPGDLFTVRNVGNLVPLPGEEAGDESVAAAIEYAVEVLRVESVTVCGHSGCGAMQALRAAETSDGGAAGGGSPLTRWLRHGRASVERTSVTAAGTAGGAPVPRLADRETADGLEALCLHNVLQQLEHLRAHDCVSRRLRDGSLELHGMYFDVARAQAYVLAPAESAEPIFAPVRPEAREIA